MTDAQRAARDAALDSAMESRNVAMRLESALVDLSIFKAWLRAHRSDIEHDINDYGDLRPYLGLLDG